MTTSIITTPTQTTTIRDCISIYEFVMILVYFIGSILFVVTMWHMERSSRSKYRRTFVEGNFS